MINNNSIPKYVQIHTYLEGLIKRGRIKVGDQLPTEEKIAADFKVNRMTVRQAIDEFVVKKMVIRERGRGSFLIRNSPEEYVWHFNNITSFTDSMLDAGIKSDSENIHIDVIDADDRVCELLGLAGSDRKVIHTLRGKYAENEMVCYERSFLPYNDFREILDMDIEGSLYHILVEKFNIKLDHSSHTLSSSILNKEDKKLFNVESDISCMMVETVTYDPGNIPVEVLYTCFRGDKFKFKIESGKYIYQKKGAEL
jgi:GntR family transcriptional regulator